MKTSLFYAYMAFSSFMLFFSILLLSPVPLFVAVPFLWIILLSYIINYKPARVKREFVNQRYVEGDELHIRYNINGTGYYCVSDELFSLRGHVENRKKIRKLKTPENFGVLRLRALTVKSEDFGGIRYNESERKIHENLKIYPRIEYVRKFVIKPRRTRSLLGDYPSRRKGLGMEFRDLREYVPGDSMRWVNWKATARRDKIMVNEYESERSGDTVILLDVRRFYKGAEEYERLLNASVRAAATLVTYLSRTKNRVGAVMLGDTVDWEYPTYGKRAMYIILEKLLYSRTRKMSRLPFEYAKFIVSRFVPPNSFIIVISPLLSWDIDEAIVELMAKGYDILIISPSIIGEKEDLASEILRTARNVRLRRLRLYASVVDWNIEYPLTKVLMVMR